VKETAALVERLGKLESEERKRLESHEQKRGKIPLPPLGQGILRFLKQRNCTVQINVSSHLDGSTENLLTEDDRYWLSMDEPNSWIQWTITGGRKVIISSVKIRGDMRPPLAGVKDFMIMGSNDGAVWTTIIDSKTCPMTFENFVTEAEALPKLQLSFSIIRLTQTGPTYFPGCPEEHRLYLTYADFGGKVIFPQTAK
jgi:hypothetical protein